MRNPIVTFIVGLVIGLAVAGGTFFLGMNQGQAQAQDDRAAALQRLGIDPATAGGAGGFAGQGGFARQGGAGAAGGAGRGNGTIGVIKSISGNTITITPGNPFANNAAATPQADLTVTLGDSTMILKQDTGTIADLKAGDRVTVAGQRSGTNIAATTIQLVPAGAAFGGPRADRTPGAAPAATP